MKTLFQISVIVFAFVSTICCERTSASDVGNFKAFKDSISGEQPTYSIEFVEGDISKGDISNNATNSATVQQSPDGRLIFGISKRHYHAICQSNAFELIETPTKVTLGKKTISFFANSGRFGNDAWYQSGRGYVFMVSLDNNTLDASIQAKISQIKRAESMTWCAANLGIPQLFPNSIQWDGQNFAGKAMSGVNISGELFLDGTSKLVTSAIYSLQGVNDETATISYLYDSNNLSVLPNIVKKRVHLPRASFLAADNSFDLKIISRTTLTNILGSSEFLASVQKASALVSNGIPMAKVGGKFLEGKAFAAATHSQIQVTPSHGPQIIFILIFVITNFTLIGIFLAKCKSQNSQPKT